MTGILPRLVQTDEPAPASVLVGTLGKSPLIDRLVEAGKLDASSVSGQWESYLIATVDGCLVIAGSDKRGTIYGIIMGTSHHKPMMRAHKEYTRRRDEVGEWNYATNKTRLDRFFRDGLERNRTYDNLIIIGMRGDGDVAMGKGDDEENMQTLAKVVEGQRAIISEVYGRPASEVPQLWAIFTEVQRYYDKGFTVPDDVLLLFCDNNWGYIRRTGPLKERNRRGGMGLYYHIDMNGGPWNDRWVNTSPIPKLREQFHLAYETGIDDLWIVNVGDLKPKELPIDFILRYAWDPDAIPADRTDDYLRAWVGENFGEAHADAVAALVSAYPKYNLWRKAEVQVPGIFSVVNYHESDRTEQLWQDVAHRADSLRRLLPAALLQRYPRRRQVEEHDAGHSHRVHAVVDAREGGAARARPCYPDRIPGAGRQRGRQRSHGAGRQPDTPCI